MPAPAPISAVVVSAFNAPDDVEATVRTLLAQTRPPAEVLLVDNHPEGAVGDALEQRDLPVRVLRPTQNLGFGGGCNLAARHAGQPWLFFLNPDAQAEPDCLERLLDAAGDEVAILGAQVLLPDGATTNAGDNPVHVAGLSWAGRYGAPREDGPPRDVACVSGAALLARAADLRALGGFNPAFFLYVEDVDLCWRARLAGRRVRFVPGARVRHDYAFDKGARKWSELEHNRLWAVLANYRLSTLVLLAPLLLAAEAGIALLAVRDGWWPQKAGAWRRLAAEWRALGRWRRFVQRGRRAGDAEVLEAMTATLRNPLVRAPMLWLVEPVLAAYRRAVIRCARRRDRRARRSACPR